MILVAIALSWAACPWSNHPTVATTFRDITIDGTSYDLRGNEWRELHATMLSCGETEAADALLHWRSSVNLMWVPPWFPAAMWAAYYREETATALR